MTRKLDITLFGILPVEKRIGTNTAERERERERERRDDGKPGYHDICLPTNTTVVVPWYGRPTLELITLYFHCLL